MGADQLYTRSPEGIVDQCPGRFRRIALSLKDGCDAVRDFDHAIVVFPSLETGSADHRVLLAMNDEKPMPPGVGIRGIAERTEPRRGDFTGDVTLAESGPG